MVVTVEQDHESGLKATRAGYQRILALARSGRITDVVVYAASRFGRRASEVLARIEELRDEHDVMLHATQEDLSNFVVTGIMAVINEEASRSISRLASPAKLHRAEQGFWLAHAPFGTRNNQGMLEASDEIDILRGMFERAAEGVSVRQITLWANDLRSAPLTREGVREILRNDAYIGRTRWARQTFAGRWEPLIDVGLWKRAQNVVRGRANVRAPIDGARPHWILGLAYCGRCGHRMSRRIATKTWGTRYEYLACNRPDRRRVIVGCGSPHVPIRPLQARVLDELRACGLDRSSVDLLCRELRDQAEHGSEEQRRRREGLAAERKRLMNRRARAQRAYMDDVFDKREFQRATNGLSDAIAVIDEQLADSTPAADIDAELERCREFFGSDEWIRRADEAPIEFRQVLACFVERIDVHPLRIVWRVAMPARAAVKV